MEATLIPAKEWSYRAINCGKLRRYFSWSNFSDFFRALAGIIESLFVIARFRPDVIFCKGGYVSLPVAVAGGLLRRPVIIHESDLEMGLANRLAASFARVICVSFPETAERLRNDKRVVLTGNPVRRELLEGDPQKGYAFCDFKPHKKVVLVMGGSQGAQSINQMLRRNLDRLLAKYQIVHICGRGNVEEKCMREGYLQLEFVGDELKDVYAITDLVISRAGANSLAEIAALGLPALLVPLQAGSRGDQIKNAESFAKRHPALVVNDLEINREHFDLLKDLDRLSTLAGQPSRHQTLRISGRQLRQCQEASEKVVEIIESFAKPNDQKS
jgi:UDP-N-acetylglucosamine--N-acetylmuramyl-(pentapeptide) pyrophosphoryl-undecaprenol N-acetylglucosamine transferase